MIGSRLVYGIWQVEDKNMLATADLVIVDLESSSSPYLEGQHAWDC